ncbi:MAG: hypothetical protein A2W90_05610 [Bacteroidetes bacterium GWF2_42_66]|nr:MAG: hypothetical protein A2W92_00990 [Bacteroidetes bacterium GWA2_42_15]OFY03522.1 MAG: hypothetical protein A2W89_18330 [Bacteroidetes bacterium GWE2_42_39]OFY45888.1 MAG: hypothetical protein A2W90_05610 [Bacteroidetes bacterium GWF2_42_66]HBL75129.1 hypothetical protein [Prolixibacteraceae bacterium]HCR89067.1 hypothetical protein [Prolixibacteraceae bacterium]
MEYWNIGIYLSLAVLNRKSKFEIRKSLIVLMPYTVPLFFSVIPAQAGISSHITIPKILLLFSGGVPVSG